MQAMKGLYDDGVVGMAEPVRNGLDLGDQSLKRANLSGVVASSLSEVIRRTTQVRKEHEFHDG